MQISPEISLIAGLIALLAGAELLVRSATKIALFFNLSPLVIGLTIVAFGTSAPEIAVALSGSVDNHTGLGFGNVIGSNIFNLLFILGLMAVLKPLRIERKVIRVDIPLMIIASAGLLVLALDGCLSKIDSAIMLLGLVLFTVFTLRRGKKEKNDFNKDFRESWKTISHGALTLQFIILPLSVILLGWGSDRVVDGSVVIARELGIDEFIVGLTIIAVGTSLPELVTSLLALVHQRCDMAVGNIVGSNIFNILGVTSVMTLVSSGGVTVTANNLSMDLPVLLASSVFCLPIFLSGYRISRSEGVVFLIYYLVYITFFAVVTATDNFYGTYVRISMVYVIPSVFITYVFIVLKLGKRRIKNQN
ncbi:MAG: calcium/sodium antiporter [candidate division Zixibacteria bacterium]|nr:calcium/sodium antiporter [candidate division Zixibacteria bacterium]MDD5426890.1 calcium/sodium antiporter [candidate division Zixibacteria bacterium]